MGEVRSVWEIMSQFLSPLRKAGKERERSQLTCCVSQKIRVALRTETLWIGKREEIERESDVKKDNSFMWRKIMYPSIFAF